MPAWCQDWVIDADHMRHESGTTTAEQAQVTSADGTWTLTAKEVQLTHETLWVRSGTLVLSQDRSLQFETAAWSDGRWSLTGAVLNPCPCDGPSLWSVQARHARVTPSESRVDVRGAWFRVLEQPLIPVPTGRVPLSRQSGFLAPQLGYGEQGVRVAQPLYLTLGAHADTTLTPEHRTLRGSRLNHELRWAERNGSGTLNSDGVRDSVTSSWRGASSVDLSTVGQQMRAAIRSQWVTDPDYLADWGSNWIDRRQPWTYQRGVAAIGPVEASLLGVQADGPTQQAAHAIWRPRTSEGPLDSLWTVQAGGGATWTGAVPTELQDPEGLAWSQASIQRPTWVGPVLAEPSVTGRMFADASGFGGDLRAGGSARLPLWKASGGHMQRIEPGWGAWTDIGETLDWRTGPVLRMSRMGTHRVLLESRAWTDGADLGVRSIAQLQRGWLQGRAWIDVGSEGTSTESSIGVHGSRSSLDIGAIQADATRVYTTETLSQGWTAARLGLPDPKATLHLRGHARADLEGSTLREAGIGAGWLHPTGCARLDLGGTWVDDRSLPDLALNLGLRL